jgi:hypothetical protein
VDQDPTLARELDKSKEHANVCARTMEEAGAGILQRKSPVEVGTALVQCGQSMQLLATSIAALAPAQNEAQESSQRMTFAAERMLLAGTALQGTTTEKPKGKKSWLSG